MPDYSGELFDLFDLIDGWTAAQLIANGQLSSALGLAGVAQYSLNSLDVGFTADPIAFDPYATGDALNPSSYSITSELCRAPMIVRVECVGPGVFRLFFDAKLKNGCEYRISMSGIETEFGELLGSASAMFVALGSGSASSSSIERNQTDFLNIPGSSAGVQYDSSGDIANHSGISYLRKRILRRITTVAGGFFHLPAYGAGQKLKGHTSRARQRVLESKIKAQCELEPDVNKVRVVVRNTHASIFFVTVVVESADGGSLKVTENIDMAGV